MKEFATKIIGMVFSATDTPMKKVIKKLKYFQASIAAATVLCTYLVKRRMGKITKTVNAESTFIKKKNVKKTINSLHYNINQSKGYVDYEFFLKLVKLLKIAFPKLFGRETLSVFALSVLLVLRSMLSIYISDINGSIVKAIVGVNFLSFVKQV